MDKPTRDLIVTLRGIADANRLTGHYEAAAAYDDAANFLEADVIGGDLDE